MKKILTACAILALTLLFAVSCSECEHEYSEWTEIKSATCSERGVEQRKCKKCLHTEEKNTFTADHTADRWITVEEPSITSEGLATAACKWCGKELSRTLDRLYSEGLSYDIVKNSYSEYCMITGIGDCKDTVVSIPEIIDGYTVKEIGKNAFKDCTSLTAIIIPDTVTRIHSGAFFGCSGLTEITIPASVNSIDKQIFSRCDNLKTVYYNASADIYNYSVFSESKSIEKVVFGGEEIPRDICYECTNVKEIVILDNVKKINGFAFKGCTGIKKIVLPEGLTYIGVASFQDCTALEEINLPRSLTYLGSSAFDGCISLKNAIIPDGITALERFTYKDCTAFDWVVVPYTVTSVDGTSLSSVKKIFFGGRADEWERAVDDLTTGMARATVYYYAETKPADAGNYWHYVNGVPTPW